MKNIYSLILFLLLSTIAVGQQYGNEWIKFTQGNPQSDQQYFKIKVWRDGIYRVSPVDLITAGFPAGQDPRKFQVFHNGKEQFIFIKGESDGSFDPSDYIEFYGQKNDGTMDNELYEQSSFLINKRLSLINDTSSYFITVDPNSISNRRMVLESDLNFSGYTSATYFKKDAVYYVPAEYYDYHIDNFLSLSSYGYGEGFVCASFKDVLATYNIPTPNANNAQSAIVDMAVVGVNNRNHYYTISVDNTQYINSGIFNYAYQPHTFTLIQPISSSVKLDIDALPNSNPSWPNYMALSYFKLSYAHSLNFSGEVPSMYDMDVVANVSNPKTYLNISNLSTIAPLVYMLSGDTVKRIDFSKSGNNLEVLIPTYFADKKVLLIDSTQNILTNLTGVNFIVAPVKSQGLADGYFRNYSNNPNAEYLIISHPKLWSAAVDYKNYRQTNIYNHFNTLLVDINDLYDQFAWGIEKDPLSIKHFVDFALDNFIQKPTNLFLLGKSVELSESRFNYSDINLVPTFGNPPSDFMLTARRTLPDTLLKPRIATGRLAATTTQEVEEYLTKVTEYESAPRQPWMKNVMHFAGGLTYDQVTQFESYMAEYAAIISDTLYGGQVTTISKNTNDPIQIYLSAHLQELIDSGVSIMTFLAHASASSFDITTDDPANWHNQGKYPLIIANSCYVGNIHSHIPFASENFIFQNQKGAIGFLAQASNGYVDPLRAYTKELYKQLSYYNYNGTIGQSMVNSIDSTRNSYYNYFFGQSVTLDMNLHGDPALKINSSDKPDLVIKQSDIALEPQTITTQLDSFTVKIVIRNIGMGINKPFNVSVTRNFQNGNFLDTTFTYPFLAATDTLKVRFVTDVAQGAGVNSIAVKLDALSLIDELDENNNYALQTFFVASSDIDPIIPSKYAIVPIAPTELQGTTADPNAAPTTYVFQIDTIDTFDSPFPFNQQNKVTAPGGLVKWTLNFTPSPNVVYFWRVSRDSTTGDPIHPKWNESSFIYIPTKSGWSQAHYFQFKNDDYKNIIYNRPQRDYQYIKTQSIIKVNNNTLNDDKTINYLINGVVQDYAGCAAPAIYIAVIDNLTLVPWVNKTPGFDFGNFNNTPYLCRTDTARKDKYFVFRSNVPAEMDSMKSMLVNKIPDGFYVLAYSFLNGGFSLMDPTVKTVFHNLGSDSILTVQDNQAWIFFTQIGNIAKGHDVVTQPGVTTTCQLNDSLGGDWHKGFINSEIIGPAKKWTAFHWNVSAKEPLDSVALDIIGRDKNGNDSVFYFNVQTSTTDILNLDQVIDAAKYPFAYFRLYMQDDSILPDPVYVDRWQIYYEEEAECIADPNTLLTINKKIAEEGDSIFVKMAIRNIHNVPMDSMLVAFYLYDAKNQKITYPSVRYRPLPGNDTLHCSIGLSTKNLVGINTLWIEANPANDQPEQYHYNNYAQIQFTVKGDITNPILDVTFDGVHILNNDIVSAKPMIQITLTDENKNLVLNDTSDFFVFLTDPKGTKTRLRFESLPGTGLGKTLMKWYDANLPQNKFKIEYNPDLTDGIYTIEVQGTDRSGNPSGNNNYTSSFEVITQSTITEVINYPNPFSTATRFVFTLTGSEVPDQMMIQIMTVTGKVIRTITKDELGPLHVGRNMTQYAWDGKDQFGDQLANGVYLYRVVTRLNNEAIDKRESPVDSYFKKGWGKMYLMR